VDMAMPRPAGKQHVPGLGRVFVAYQSASEAAVAVDALAGRRYGDRTVLVAYFAPDRFRRRDF